MILRSDLIIYQCASGQLEPSKPMCFFCYLVHVLEGRNLLSRSCDKQIDMIRTSNCSIGAAYSNSLLPVEGAGHPFGSML